MKTKKIIVTLLALIGACIMMLPHFTISKADSLSSYDTAFLSFINEDFDNCEGIMYTSYDLYDENLNVNGKSFNFTIGGIKGYSLVTKLLVNGEAIYEVEEIHYSGTSPFDMATGIPVYISHSTYWEYKDNSFYDLSNNTIVSSEIYADKIALRFKYSGVVQFENVEERIEYHHKEEIENYEIYGKLPSYTTERNSSCANIAGAIVLGYYDKTLTSLIPNFNPIINVGQGFIYKNTEKTITQLINELALLMNTDNVGTTYSEFNIGMNSYVTGKGFSYSYSNVLSNANINYNLFQNYINAGCPIALFLEGYSILDEVCKSGNTDIITYNKTPTNHIVVAFGVKSINYYDSNNNLIDFRRYIAISTGLPIYNIKYLDIRENTQINKAISINIY